MKKNKISLVKFCIIVFFVIAAPTIVFVRSQYVAPVLMYHYVPLNANYGDRLSIQKDVFERQMKFLKENRFTVISLDELAGLIKMGKKIPPKTVAITFDDGAKDNYLNAFPILKKYGFPATIFLVYNEVDRSDNSRLSWNNIEEMQGSGLITFGSHTFSHKILKDISSEEELQHEIRDSKNAFEQRLGREVSLFSYPNGRFNLHIRNIVESAGYKAAVAVKTGRNHSARDVYLIKRLRVSPSSGNMVVFGFDISGYYAFFKDSKIKK
ncbi:MAG: polysaccharide deacetylase family protein [Candidatus Omnitrophica bacterium]|nr:polysaccharide deacetylase family protein [Candidatus Omnitrophota bacterium]